MDKYQSERSSSVKFSDFPNFGAVNEKANQNDWGSINDDVERSILCGFLYTMTLPTTITIATHYR